ncbi:MAG TPA: hypothetical protein VGK87_15150 [Anaerolineae bacterium]
MTNENTNQTNPEGGPRNSSEAWQEVGKQFQTMGESLATAFRTAWNDEQNRKKMQEMRTGLEAMLHDVGKALDETARSPQMQQAKSEAQKTAESLKMATEHTAQELRPLILDALRKLNNELERFVARMEPTAPAATESTAAEHEEAATPVADTEPQPASEPDK